MADNIVTGIIPFNSDDPSILLKSTLTSAASVTSPLVGSAGTFAGSGYSFDPVFGFKNGTSTSGITWSNLTGYQSLDTCGQFSFEIETPAACSNSTVYGSTGDEPNRDYSGQGLAWLIVWTADSGTTYGNIRKGNGDANSLVVSSKNAGETNGSVALHTQNKDQFTRITYSWNNNVVGFYVNGKPVTLSTAPTRNVSWADQFKTIWVMHFNGGNGVRLRYIRNLIISTKPVMLSKAAEPRIELYGHSFAANYADSNGSSAYDETIGQIIRGRYVNGGGDVSVTTDGVGGAYVISALTTAPFQLQNPTTLAAVAARKATHILLLAGTNDVGNGSYTSGAFDTDFKALLTAMAAGHDKSFTQHIYVYNVPSRYGEGSTWSTTIAANILSANAVIDGLPAWWNANISGRSGQLHVLDLFNKWGGMNPIRPVVSGLLPGATGNLHPSPLGALDIANLFLSNVQL